MSNEAKKIKQSDSAFFLIISNYKAFEEAEPELRALGQRDCKTWWQISCEQEEKSCSLFRLRNPIHSWVDTVGETFGQERLSFSDFRARQNADEQVNLNDQGEINEDRIAVMSKIDQVANAELQAAWRNRISVGSRHDLHS